MQNVLFASSNGIGLGHLARQMAVARRLSAGQKAVFFTMSYAAAALAREGYLYFATQHHHSTGMDQERWNRALGGEYLLLVDMLKPKAFVYDATAVFGGTVELLQRAPDLTSVWVRRAMWRPLHRRFLEHAFRFTQIVEPGELADELDQGPTKELQAEVLRVAPVLHLDPAERLGRSKARSLLGLPDDATVVCLQLANGSSFDIEELRKNLIARLLRHENVILIELRSALNRVPTRVAPDHARYRALELFPAYRYSKAWDAAISAAGYNSFHENILGGVPTLFIPNEGEEMDMQLHRARWAESRGCGMLIRRGDAPTSIAATIDRLVDDGERERLKSECRALPRDNGAVAIARLIDRLPPTNGKCKRSI